jgi:hypothetical protein
MGAHLVRLARFLQIFCQSAAPESSASAAYGRQYSIPFDMNRCTIPHMTPISAWVSIAAHLAPTRASPASAGSADLPPQSRPINAGNAACR